jgi:catechol 2,3-dioxygenase-like lactoylglutathione lyase family enzyme
MSLEPWLIVLSLLPGPTAVHALDAAPGQGGDPKAEPVFKAVTGAFFAVSVPDLAAAVLWYGEKLGLRTVMTTDGPGGGRVAVLEGNGLIVELVYLREAQPLARAAPSVRAEQYIHGLFKAGVVVDDFEALVAGLKARHVDIAYGPFAAREGQRANVVIRDHAGNLIQFFGR